MKGFKGEFTRIKGVSERRRLPRLGKIRLGVKKVSQRTGAEYPSETPYFVVPVEVAKVYGEKPVELDVMFAINDIDIIFPQKYTWYGVSKGPKCIGDGERAMRVNEEGVFESRECPCELLESGDCQRRAHLMVLLPHVSLGGVYQIDIGSYHSIVDINSGLEYIDALVGRFAMVPCKLRRMPRETHANGKKQVHYTLSVHFDGNVEMLNALRENTQRVLMGPQFALPAPEDINPAMDEGAVIDVVDEENEIAETESKPKEEEPRPPEPKEEEEPKVDPARPLTKQEQEIQARLMNCTDMQGLTKIFNNLTKGQRQKFLGLFNNIKKSLKQNSEIPPGEEDIPF